MPEDTIQKLVKQYIRNQIDMLESSLYIQPDEDLGETPFESMEQLEENIEWGEKLNNQLRLKSANGDFSFLEGMADELIKNTNATSIEKGTQPYTKLCGKLQEIDIRAWPLKRKAWRSDFSFREDIPEVFPEIAEDYKVQGDRSDDVEAKFPVPNGPEIEKGSPATVPDTIKLLDLYEDYKASKMKSGQWRKGVERNHQPKINALSQFVGNVPINRITKDKIREYRKLLDNLPPYFSRRKDYRDLSKVKPDVIKGKHDKTLDVTTIRGYMNFARELFRHAIDNDYIAMNPVLPGVIPPKKANTRDQRHPFSDPDDLARIFNSDLFLEWSKDRSERFWVPVLALYTGARIEELCQLEVADVAEYEGIWGIHIKGVTTDLDDPDDQKGRIKNEASKRIVPLHPFLTDYLRFPEYVEQVKAKGHERVFQHLTKSASTNWRYGHGLSTQFGYYLRQKVEITERKKTFHSFRHNVVNLLLNEMVQESVVEELEGRTGSSVGRKQYFTGYRVPVLYKEAVLKLDYKVDLTHLKASKYVPQEL